MKTLVVIVLIMLACLETVAAEPAVPIWAKSARSDAAGWEQTMFMTGINKQLNENWWVAVGYQSNKSAWGGVNIGAFYNITRHAAVSVGYSFTNNNQWTNLLRSQLYIEF